MTDQAPKNRLSHLNGDTPKLSLPPGYTEPSDLTGTSRRDRMIMALQKSGERMTQTQSVIAKRQQQLANTQHIMAIAHDNLLTVLLERGILKAEEMVPICKKEEGDN